MSRARDWTHPITGELHWFDVHGMAGIRELEVLADAEDIDLDDLFDANLSSKEVLFRLNKLSELIPEAGLNKLKKRQTQGEPETCRICPLLGRECEGRMTKHHFVPRWIMLELADYEVYAPRRLCTVPACAGSHRWLHMRTEEGSKSIAPYLDKNEKALAHHLIGTLRQERPRIYALLAGGDKNSYEWQLVQDWRRGLFDVRGEGKDPFPRWQLRNSL